MCPDEEINQTEVAEANKKIVESKQTDSDQEAADEVFDKKIEYHYNDYVITYKLEANDS